MKKVIALLLAVMMLMAFAVPTFANEAPTTGTITIQNATIGQVYKAYLVFPATIYDSSEAGNIAISYTYSGTLPDNDYFVQPGGAGEFVKAKEGADVSSAAAATFFKTLVNGVTPVSKKATTSTVVFDNLPFGYYYVESSLGAAVTVDSTTPDETVIDKNQGPSWSDPEHPTPADSGDDPVPKGNFTELGKYIIEDSNKVTENTAYFGDVINFETSFNATNYIGEDQVHVYFLYDTICDGMDIKEDSLKLYIAGTEKAKGTDYSVTWETEASDKVTARGFKISIPWEDSSTKATLYSPNAVIKVTYTAAVNDNAVLAPNENLNTTTFDYLAGTTAPADSTKPYDVPSSPYNESTPKITKTYVYALGITKVDGGEKRILKGAEFSVKNGDKVIKANETGTTGVYEYAADGAVSTFKTDTNGRLLIKGLEAGTYSISEEKAPNGYNRLLNSISVELKKENVIEKPNKAVVYYTADKGEITTAETSYKIEVDYGVNAVPLFIANERGVELPVTGGMGTTLFYIVGGALALGAFVLLLAKKRMKSKE